MALRPRLIEAVKRHPNLYNTELPSYKDNALRDKTWLEISQELNENCELVRREWKILRDSFRQAVNRRVVTRHGLKPTRWRFSEQMSYLLPHMTHRQSDGLRTPYINPLPDQASSAGSVEEIEEVFDTEPEFEEPNRTEEKTNWTEPSYSRSLPVKAEKTDDDDLELFFKSLLSTTRKLPKNYQIKIKQRMLEVVSKVEEQYYADEQT